MSRDFRPATEASFGLVPYQCHTSPVRVLLVQQRAGHWGFPKGHAHDDETPLAAACRE